MASSGSVKAYHPNNGAYWSFEWSAEATSVKGQTKVSYNIYRSINGGSYTAIATGVSGNSYT